MSRTDTHLLTISKPDGSRLSLAGTLKELKAEQERLLKLHRGASADISKR